MSNLFLMDKKIYKQSKELCLFRIVWETEHYKNHWREMRLLRIKNNKYFKTKAYEREDYFKEHFMDD